MFQGNFYNVSAFQSIQNTWKQMIEQIEGIHQGFFRGFSQNNFFTLSLQIKRIVSNKLDNNKFSPIFT